MSEDFNLKDGVQTEEEARYHLEETKLSSRKKMAWFSLSGIFGIMLGIFLVYFHKEFNVDKFSAIRPLLETCIFSLTSIVGFYIGSRTFAESKWSKEGTEKEK